MEGTAAQQEARAVVADVVDAQNSGDAARLRVLLSQRADAIHIGTDADEWWTSKQLIDALAADVSSDGIQVVTDDIDIHVHGDVAWAEGRGRFTIPDGGEQPVRMTCVLVREDQRWTVVQSHASIAVPNADMFS